MIGVLLLSYGTPANLSEIETYLKSVIKNRPVTPEMIEDLKHRYELIGGKSPLKEITEHQVETLSQTLGDDVKVYYGFKHGSPSALETLAVMKEDKIKFGVALVVAPFYSVMSRSEYFSDVREDRHIKFKIVTSWNENKRFLYAIAKRVGHEIETLGDNFSKTKIIFSAHSLPKEILELDDPYVDEIRESVRHVTRALGLTEDKFAIGWQSAPKRSRVPWLSKTIYEVADDMIAQEKNNIENIIICPIGFVVDNLETLYDLDIEFKEYLKNKNINLIRTKNLNSDEDFILTLKEIIEEQL